MVRPEDAAQALWPVIVGGRFADVVEAFRKYGAAVRADEREACAQRGKDACLAALHGPVDLSEEQIANAVAGAVLERGGRD